MKIIYENIERLEIDSLLPLLKDFISFSKNYLKYDKNFKVVFKSDRNNAMNVLGRTGHYNPDSMEVLVYISDRHPKDILRSLSHEIVHHAQNCRGDFANIGPTVQGYAQSDQRLRNLEREAYELGNLVLRDFEDGLKCGEITIMSEEKIKKAVEKGIENYLNESKGATTATVPAKDDKVTKEKKDKDKPVKNWYYGELFETLKKKYTRR